MYVKVVLRESTLDFDKKYIYFIPEEFRDEKLVGAKVKIPFGKNKNPVDGYVVEVIRQEPSPFEVKAVSDVEKPCPVLMEEQLRLAERMKKKYACTYGNALKLMVAAIPSKAVKKDKTAYLVNPSEAILLVNEGQISHINQVRVIEYLIEYGESTHSDIISGCKITKSTLMTMRKKEIIEFSEKESDEKQGGDNSYKICGNDLEKPFMLNNEQQKAVSRIIESQNDVFNEFLLHGITGSGKTEVYMHVIGELRARGKGAILLVPEISLTPQMITRLKNRFGDEIRVLHSRLTPKQRFEQWRDILEGKASLAVGARSAVFAPVKNLGLIIIDEEQETSYRSQTHPAYEAYDIAKMRMMDNKGILILGSATPKTETYHRAKSGESELLKISERVLKGNLPDVCVVDLKKELAEGNKSVFSRVLKQEMTDAFERGEQAILFINRRGYHGFYLCRDCGHVPKCKSCSVSLTYHLANKALICHYCGKMYKVVDICPECKSKRIGGFGAGTQKVEELCKKEFEGRKVLRMDQDTTSGRGSHETILKQFENREADILIGTQMIAKGHDYENVTVVGVLAADMILGMPDFRASERTFQLITQSIGRAGRGKKPGKAIIQAYNCDDYSVDFASRQDYEGFYEKEIVFRKNMQYPPFSAFGIIIVSAQTDFDARKGAEKIRRDFLEYVKNGSRDSKLVSVPEILETGKAPMHKIRNRYRYRIVIKARDEKELAFYTKRVRAINLGRKTMVSYDINPFQMY